MRILLSCSLVCCLVNVNGHADPTRPAQHSPRMTLSASEIQEPFRLSLIRWQDHQSSAMINGQLMKSGDFILGYQLREVHHDHVVLESATDRLQLFIFQKITHHE